jgi:hypothetical protein
MEIIFLMKLMTKSMYSIYIYFNKLYNQSFSSTSRPSSLSSSIKYKMGNNFTNNIHLNNSNSNSSNNSNSSGTNAPNTTSPVNNTNINDFTNNNTNSNNNEVTNGESRANRCRVCGKTYARPSTLKTHMRTHSV